MKLLLTGSSGFLGRNALLYFLKLDSISKIYLPVRNPEKLERQLSQEKTITNLDKVEILRAEAPHWNELQGLELDFLIHSAGLLFGRTENEFRETNVTGTEELLKKVRAEKTILISSQAASGPCLASELTKTEASPSQPISFYGKSKLEMETKVQKEFSDRSILILRPPMILGPRDQATLPLFKMAKSRILFKPGLRPKTYSFISVDDLVEALGLVLKKDVPFESGVYFVAHESPVTDEMLLRGSAKAADITAALVKVPQMVLKGISKAIDQIPAFRQAVPSLSGDRAREIWPERWVVSSEKFSKQFSWTAKRSLDEALKDAYDWYLKEGALS